MAPICFAWHDTQRRVHSAYAGIVAESRIQDNVTARLAPEAIRPSEEVITRCPTFSKEDVKNPHTSSCYGICAAGWENVGVYVCGVSTQKCKEVHVPLA